MATRPEPRPEFIRRPTAVHGGAERRAAAVHRISILQPRSTPPWAKVRNKSAVDAARFSLVGDADISRHNNRQLFPEADTTSMLWENSKLGDSLLRFFKEFFFPLSHEGSGTLKGSRPNLPQLSLKSAPPSLCTIFCPEASALPDLQLTLRKTASCGVRVEPLRAAQ